MNTSAKLLFLTVLLAHLAPVVFLVLVVLARGAPGGARLFGLTLRYYSSSCAASRAR